MNDNIVSELSTGLQSSWDQNRGKSEAGIGLNGSSFTEVQRRTTQIDLQYCCRAAMIMRAALADIQFLIVESCQEGQQGTIRRRTAGHRNEKNRTTRCFRAEFAEMLREMNGSSVNKDDFDGSWRKEKKSVFQTVCPMLPLRPYENKILSRSAALSDAGNIVLATNDSVGARIFLKHRIRETLKSDGERWWTSDVREMDKSFAVRNNRTVSRLIR
ncbi:hypothetical protein CLF_102947 [Clonorchis sinensis]|uniref:ATP-binding cassette transporter n=1 Tax=Clonorchis sinensis TaxID=79923 RepID=G7Y8U6_CLOSI|nr:hypothetical protein CLF_102947 [Clonorchis sinensis]